MIQILEFARYFLHIMFQSIGNYEQKLPNDLHNTYPFMTLENGVLKASSASNSTRKFGSRRLNFNPSSLI